ncbi:glycine cleavage system H protein-like [Convolutriloba macropyga]|uniref:glycine cleavage system H protein-like n=1 Tax=Convolutriloba macropyga TaxID=536237 RepID=UPI003F51F0D8
MRAIVLFCTFLCGAISDARGDGSDYIFTRQHVWTKMGESYVTSGLTTNGRRELGKIFSILLPKVGEFIVQGEVLAVIESSTGVHYKYVPFSGVVIAINQEVISDPGFLDQFHSWVAPDEEGWFLKVVPSNLDEEKTNLTPLADRLLYMFDIGAFEDFQPPEDFFN